MLTGRCQCGAVRFEIDGAPRGLYVCHCLECRRQSASAFGISVDVAEEALRLTQGEPQSWARPTPHGHLICYFCPACGSRLWHAPDPRDGAVTVKGGTLDEPPDLSGAVHIWTKRKMPGLMIPDDVEQWPEEPEQR